MVYKHQVECRVVQHMDSNIKSVHKESHHKYLINQSMIIKWSAR